MDTQRQLFDHLRAISSDEKMLENKLVHCLDTDHRKARRLMACETHIRLSELVQMAPHFNFSIDALLNTGQVGFQHAAAGGSPAESYLAYLKTFLEELRALEKAENGSMVLAVEGIPTVHCMAYPMLMFFKLYCWQREATDYAKSFETFLEEIDRSAYEYYFIQITEAYSHIPADEIWVLQAFHPLRARLMDGLENGYFESVESARKIGYALMLLVERLSQYARAGSKGIGGDFRLYHSAVPLGANGILLSERDGRLSVRLKQLNMVGIKTQSPVFCQEMQGRLSRVRRNARPVAASDQEAEGHFFDQLRHEAESLCKHLGELDSPSAQGSNNVKD